VVVTEDSFEPIGVKESTALIEKDERKKPVKNNVITRAIDLSRRKK